MMKNTATIPAEQLQCLREHLNKAFQILESLTGDSGVQKAPRKAPRETKAQKLKRIDDLITGKTRARKPDYLKTGRNKKA